MMQEPKNSGLTEVAGKLTNAFGRSRAEPMGRSEGAQGNLEFNRGFL